MKMTLKFRFLHERHPAHGEDHDVVRESQNKAFKKYQHELEVALGPSKMHEDADVTLRYLSWKPLENNRAKARKNEERRSDQEITGIDEAK